MMQSSNLVLGGGHRFIGVRGLFHEGGTFYPNEGGGGQTFGPNDGMWMGLGYQFSLIGSRPI